MVTSSADQGQLAAGDGKRCRASVVVLSTFLHGYQNYLDFPSCPSHSAGSINPWILAELPPTAEMADNSQTSLGNSAPLAVDPNLNLKAKLRNLQLSNLLYGYDYYTDDKVLKKMVGFTDDTITNQTINGKATLKSQAEAVVHVSAVPEHAPQIEVLPEKKKPSEQEIRQAIRINSQNPSSKAGTRRPSETPIVHEKGPASRSVPGSVVSQERYDNFSSRLDAAMQRARGNVPAAQLPPPPPRPEPSYTHALQHSTTPSVSFIRNPNFYDQPRRLADVLPPILLQCSTTGRVVAARSSSTSGEEVPRPFRPAVNSVRDCCQNQEVQRLYFPVRPAPVARETLV